jgi:hypothetical protein
MAESGRDFEGGVSVDGVSGLWMAGRGEWTMAVSAGRNDARGRVGAAIPAMNGRGTMHPAIPAINGRGTGGAA